MQKLSSNTVSDCITYSAFSLLIKILLKKFHFKQTSDHSAQQNYYFIFLNLINYF